MYIYIAFYFCQTKYIHSSSIKHEKYLKSVMPLVLLEDSTSKIFETLSVIKECTQSQFQHEPVSTEPQDIKAQLFKRAAIHCMLQSDICKLLPFQQVTLSTAIYVLLYSNIYSSKEGAYT